jgi:DNA uptake protein ComE-like DNA-binding protein
MYRKFLREFFLLARGERRGLIIVSGLLVLSSGIRIFMGALPERPPPGMEEFKAEAKQLTVLWNQADSLEEGSPKLNPGPKPRLEPPVKTRQYEPNRVQKYQTISHPIEINSTDSAGLLPLPGIGPVFAGRLIKYRKLLGGYADPSQLLEVYGMDSVRLSGFMEWVCIDTSAIRKIDINQASFRDLLRHPYLQYEDVKAIVRYRESMGSISTLKELRIHALVPDSTLLLMEPYLRF